MSKRKKLVWLGIARWIILCLPIIILVSFRWNIYVQVKGGALTLTVSGIVGVVLFGFQAASKLPKNINSGLKWGILTFVVWLLDPLVNDLFLICLAITAGQIGYALLSPFYTATQKSIERDKNSDSLTEAIRNAGLGGRV